MNSLTQLTAQQLRQAADIQDKITVLKSQLAEILGATPSSGASRLGGRASTSPSGDNKGRTMSAVARAKIAAIARARWKKAKAAGKNAL